MPRAPTNRTGAIITLNLGLSFWEVDPSATYSSATTLASIALGGAAEALHRAGVELAEQHINGVGVNRGAK